MTKGDSALHQLLWSDGVPVLELLIFEKAALQ